MISLVNLKNNKPLAKPIGVRRRFFFIFLKNFFNFFEIFFSLCGVGFSVIFLNFNINGVLVWDFFLNGVINKYKYRWYEILILKLSMLNVINQEISCVRVIGVEEREKKRCSHKKYS